MNLEIQEKRKKMIKRALEKYGKNSIQKINTLNRIKSNLPYVVNKYIGKIEKYFLNHKYYFYEITEEESECYILYVI